MKSTQVGFILAVDWGVVNFPRGPGPTIVEGGFSGRWRNLDPNETCSAPLRGSHSGFIGAISSEGLRKKHGGKCQLA